MQKIKMIIIFLTSPKSNQHKFSPWDIININGGRDVHLGLKTIKGKHIES